MPRTIITASLLVVTLLSSVALAGPSVVAVDAADGALGTRALQSLMLQALTDQGLETADPQVLQVPVPSSAARELAAEGGAGRLFVLHLAPLEGSMLASLEEVSVEDGRTLGRASLLIQSAVDSQRSLARLARAVVAREPLREGQLVSTVTEAEGQPYSKQPGEFLFGMALFGGLGAAQLDPVPGLYGGNIRFFYELPQVNFGVTVGGGGSQGAGMFEATIRAHYLFSESDVSGYLGGGLGVSFMIADDHEFTYGAHFVLSGGVEAFRLHATRLIVGVDVMLPAYTLAGDTNYDWDPVSQESITTKADDVYMVVPMLTFGLMF